MLSIDTETKKILKKCIGKKITYIESSRINYSEIEVSFPDRRLRFSFFGGFNFELKSEFFEADYGEMFHDYTITENTPHTGEGSNYTLNFDVIKWIEIFGRPFPIEEFKSYPDIYKEFEKIDKTDNLFMFHAANGERIMLVMHDYMPDINLYVGEKMINWFFENTLSKYLLHHTIE
jgi:hypothetical protein